MAATSPDRLFRLDGAVAVVTGGASGIGLATTKLFLGAGASVVVIDASALPDVGAGKVRAVRADVADPAAVREAFSAIAADSGKIDIVVNSAGVAIRRPALEVTPEDWDRVVAVNMTGTFLCAREGARCMIEHGQGGSIVNVASIMGLSGGGLYPNISYRRPRAPSSI